MTGEIVKFASSIGFPSRYDAYRSRKREPGFLDTRLAEEVANAPLRACVLLECIVVLQFFIPI